MVQNCLPFDRYHHTRDIQFFFLVILCSDHRVCFPSYTLPSKDRVLCTHTHTFTIIRVNYLGPIIFQTHVYVSFQNQVRRVCKFHPLLGSSLSISYDTNTYVWNPIFSHRLQSAHHCYEYCTVLVAQWIALNFWFVLLCFSAPFAPFLISRFPSKKKNVSRRKHFCYCVLPHFITSSHLLIISSVEIKIKSLSVSIQSLRFLYRARVRWSNQRSQLVSFSVSQTVQLGLTCTCSVLFCFFFFIYFCAYSTMSVRGHRSDNSRTKRVFPFFLVLVL